MRQALQLTLLVRLGIAMNRKFTGTPCGYMSMGHR